MPSQRVLIADPQFLTRKGLADLFRSQPGYEVVAEVGQRAEWLAQLRKQEADLIVFDFDFPDQLSIEDLETARMICPKAGILVITANVNKERIYGVIEKGVVNILTKNCSQDEILNAAQAAVRGEKFFCNKVLDIILEKTFPVREESCDEIGLSVREMEILSLVALGSTAKEIAVKLKLSPHTVYTHRKNIMKKLGLRSGSEMIRFALDKGVTVSA